MNTLVINKEDLRHNINKIKEYAKKSGQDDAGKDVKIIAVVKGNGYGMGIVEYTKFLIDNGISMFAVSTMEEALKLRKEGIKEEILMLSSTAIEDDVRTLVKNKIILTIGSKEDIIIAEKIGKEENQTIRVHLKIDTGFGRCGFVYSKRDEMVEALKNIQNVKIEGTYTHFSISFFDEKYTKLQFKRFIDVIEVLKMNKIETGMLHVCNSSAFVKFNSNLFCSGGAKTAFASDSILQRIYLLIPCHDIRCNDHLGYPLSRFHHQILLAVVMQGY